MTRTANNRLASLRDIIDELKKHSRTDALEHMAEYGINVENCLGCSMPSIRDTGKRIGKDHDMAIALWKTGIHDARILAGLVDVPQKVTPKQMDSWAADFNSWDLCDQSCNNLFVYTAHAWDKAVEWIERDEEYVKRAGFVLMAVLAVHDKTASDADFIRLLALIEKRAADDRNMVKKGVNWALRQIGKRNMHLNKSALKSCENISKIGSKGASWAAADAIRELNNPKIIERTISKNKSRA